MLVQLRHVVCLLVLLQCCWSVCLADSSSRPTGSQDFGSVTSRLKESIDNAENLIAEGRACGKVWKEYLSVYNTKAEEAKKASKEMEGFLGVVESEAKTSDVVVRPSEVKSKPSKTAKLKKKLVTANESVTTTRGAIAEAMAALAKAESVRAACRELRDSMGAEERKLGDILSVFEKLLPEVTERTEKMKRLKESGEKTIKALSEMIIEGIKGPLGDDRNLPENGEWVEKVEIAVIEANAKLDAISKAIEPKERPPWFEDPPIPVKTRFKWEISDGEKAKEEKLKEIKSLDDKVKEHQGGLDKTVEERLSKAKKDEADRLSEERKKVEEAEMEREKQEQAIREAEEKKKAEEETEKARAAEEEKKKAEEEAQKARAAEEKKKAEEEAKRAKEEAEKRAKEELEKVRKNSDVSSSPALVHSPLLLLLLCVLGSILVC